MVKRWLVVVVVLAALAGTTGCDVWWSSPRFGPGNTGNNDADATITPTTIRAMQKRFSASLGMVAPTSPKALPISPVTGSGKVFAATQGDVLGFDAYGVDGCSGSPTTCTPTWSGDYGHPTWWSMFGPTVANDIVYVLAGDPSIPVGGLFAYDAKGVRGCTGTPAVCQPLWSAPIVTNDSPTVAGGKVYAINAGGRLEVYDAAGVEGCSGDPVVCQPLWTTTTVGMVVPPNKAAVADGVAYTVDHNGTLVASDANGVTNCSGTPKVCQPLWTATGSDPIFGGLPPAPVVGGGHVYAVQGFGTRAFVVAYDAAGTTNCSGTPTTCTPLWRTPVTASVGFFYQLALTDEFLIVPNAVTDPNILFDPPSKAFRVDGAGCGPTSCPAAFNAGGGFVPTVINHLLLYQTGSGALGAIDAHGITGCEPRGCRPLAESGYVGLGAGILAPANGKVFSVSVASDGTATLAAAW